MSGTWLGGRWAELKIAMMVAGIGGWAVLSSSVFAAPPPPVGQNPPPRNPPAQNPPPQNPPAQNPPAQNPPAQNPPTATPTAAQVGRALFFDTTMSNPTGMACATCHAPQTGWTYPVSTVNQNLGPVPGIVSGRFGNRRVPTVGYATFLTQGPPAFNPALFGYVGGLFYDGRTNNLTTQAPFPMQNPNEMNDDVHNVGSPALIVQKVQNGPNANLFTQVYGADIFSQPTATVMADIAGSIAAFESTPEVSPFSSKYDAYVAGTVQLAPNEMMGLQLFTGSTTGRPGGPAAVKFAQCILCHAIQAKAGTGPDLFTNSVFANTGVPKNPNNPFYKETSAAADPAGYNPLGAAYIDYGLGDFLYPQAGLPAGNVGRGSNGLGDYLKINGVFKTSTLRNVDKRPSSGFIKAYTHNGFFKSLPQIVHFYNTRNLTSVPGEVINLALPNPYAGLKGKPLWPPPENLNTATLVNPSGATPANGGIVGNLGLTPQDEGNLVAFLKTLSDAPPSPAKN